MADFICVIGENKLYELSMMFENVDSHHCLVKFFAGTVDLIKVLTLLVI